MKRIFPVIVVSLLITQVSRGESILRWHSTHAAYDQYGLDSDLTLVKKTQIGKLGGKGQGESSIPIYLDFNTSGASSSVLPPGWGLPLLESSAFLTSEELIKVVLPDGSVRLFPDRVGEENWETEFQSWHLERKGAVFVATSNKSNERFEFLNGRLVKYVSGKGARMAFSYSKAGQVKISDEKGRVMLETDLRTSGPTSLLSFLIPGVSKKGIVEFVDTSLATVESLYGNRRRSLDGVRTVTTSEGHKILIEQVFKDGMHGLELSSDDRDEVSRFFWDESGKAAYLPSGHRVVVSRPNNECNIPAITLEKEGDRICLQNAQHQSAKGRSITYKPDGTVVESLYSVSSKGKGLLRAIYEVSSSGDRKRVYRAYYNEEGEVIRDFKNGFERRLSGDKYDIFEDGKFVYSYHLPKKIN